MSAQANLRLVENGEVPEDGPQTFGEALVALAAAEDVIAGLERDIRGWTTRYAQLERDRVADAMRHELWDQAEELFGYWRLRCKHPRSKFTFDRFEVVRPYLQKYGIDTCKKAIDGAAFDPYTTTLRNGRTKRHDDWGLIFRDADKLESFVNRAPIEKAG